MSDRASDGARGSVLAAWWRPALPILVLIVAQLVLRHAGVDAGALLASIAARHRGAAILLFVPAAAALSFVGVPRQIVAYAAGVGFGAMGGTLLALLGTVLGCAASFAWSRRLARAWVQRRLNDRIARVDRMLSAQPFTATLMLRLLPVGNNVILNLIAGVSAVAPLPFLLGSTLGYVPQTLVFVLIGAGTQIGQRTLLALGVALFAASGALGVVLLRRK